MISYNVGSREMCSRIKDKLKVNITICFEMKNLKSSVFFLNS
jgi:hypothetical protein